MSVSKTRQKLVDVARQLFAKNGTPVMTEKPGYILMFNSLMSVKFLIYNCLSIFILLFDKDIKGKLILIFRSFRSGR